MRHHLFATACALAVAAAAAAQPKPDFSGEWVLNRQASTLSPAAAGVQSGVVRIEHRDPTFRYEATLVTAGNPIDYAYELPTDGRDVAGTQPGFSAISSLRWEGDTLVFTSRVERGGRETRVSFRYDLVDGGRRLRGVEQVRGAREQDNTWIFDRR